MLRPFFLPSLAFGTIAEFGYASLSCDEHIIVISVSLDWLVSKKEGQDSIREMLKRVGEKFLIFDNDLLADLERFESSSPISSSFIEIARDGLSSVASAGSLPFHLVSHSVHQRRFDQIHTAERIRAMKFELIDKIPPEEVSRRAFQSENNEMSKFVVSEEGVHFFRDEIIRHLDQHLLSSNVAEASFQLLIQTLISTWTVFESSIRNFIIKWVNINPQATIKILASPELRNYFGKQVVDISVIGQHEFDLTSSMGDILFKERRLDNLNIVRNVLDAIFNSQTVRDSLGEDMWMLNQRRHLFVHRLGFVDAEYLEKTGESIPIGERLSIKSDDVEHYIRAVQRAFVTIAEAADEVR
jgi:hypothetical protein